MTQSQPKPVLTWILAEGSEGAPWPCPRVRIAVAVSGGEQTRTYDAIPSVCGNPRCGCQKLRFEFWGGAIEEMAPAPVWYDMAKGKTERTPELAADAVATRLAGALDGAFEEKTAGELRDWFLAEGNESKPR